jgi:hypothetical protein
MDYCSIIPGQPLSKAAIAETSHSAAATIISGCVEVADHLVLPSSGLPSHFQPRQAVHSHNRSTLSALARGGASFS